jgi:hypothetical protein
MRTLEVRRHSLRKHGGGSQLSQAGVDLARRIGASMGPFANVATSVSPRARETAIAMGFAVDHELVTLVTDDEIAQEFEGLPPATGGAWFESLARVVKAGGATWRYAGSIAALWRDMMTPLPDGHSVLVIGHSGQLEAALVACFPSANHGAWGGPFDCLEGARLTFDGEPARFTAVEIIRRPDT